MITCDQKIRNTTLITNTSIVFALPSHANDIYDEIHVLGTLNGSKANNLISWQFDFVTEIIKALTPKDINFQIFILSNKDF